MNWAGRVTLSVVLWVIVVYTESINVQMEVLKQADVDFIHLVVCIAMIVFIMFGGES